MRDDHETVGEQQANPDPPDADEPGPSDRATAWLRDVEPTSTNHVDVWLHLAVLALVDHLRTLEPRGELRPILKRFPFAAAYLDAVVPLLPAGMSWGAAHRFLSDRVGAWDGDHHDDLALRRLAKALDLDDGAIIGLLLSALVEEDSRFGQMFEHLNAGVARRPTLETATAVVSRYGGSRSADGIMRLIASGVLDVTDDSGPRSEWVLTIARDIWEALRDRSPSTLRHRRFGSLPEFEEIVLTDSTLERCRRVAGAWQSLDLVVVRGSQGSDRLALVEAMARAAGLGAIHLEGPTVRPALGALGAILRATPVVELDLPPGETVTFARPSGLVGPLVVVLGATGGIDRRGHDRAITVDVPQLELDERARRWRVALGDASVDDLDGIAAACRLQGAHIDRCARSATALAAVDGSNSVSLAHVRAATDDLQRQMLDTLATRLDAAGCWDDVVVGDFTALKLAELEARCRHRDAIGAALGAAYGTGTGIGVRAMFSGASGTGKTLAARVLGSRLGLDVYRVDLAAIVNKYVGETEKNLHRLFSTAEELDVVLLIDEADSLLGRRTEVRSANDRFANLETNYLLQRLEHYRGIVVTTTNAADQIDTAFQRRMDVVVSFLPPTPRERAEIWRLHLPADHAVPIALVLELAQRCSMTGGQIRNAVLHAVLMALGEDRPLGADDVEQAVASEYQKAGASSPYDPNGRREPVSRARSFHQVIA